MECIMATIGDVMTEDLWLDCVDDILKDNQHNSMECIRT